MKVRVISTVVAAVCAVVAAIGLPVLAGSEDASLADIVTVRPDEAESSKQGLPIFPGISGKTAGATGIPGFRAARPAWPRV